MASSLLENAEPVLRTVRLLVVDWVEEFLEITEHGVLLVGLALDFCVEAILDVLLNGASERGVRLVDCTLNFHEPVKVGFHVSGRDRCIVEVMADNIEETDACERVDQRLNKHRVFVPGQLQRTLERVNLVLDASGVGTVAPAFRTFGRQFVHLNGCLLQVVVHMLSYGCLSLSLGRQLLLLTALLSRCL